MPTFFLNRCVQYMELCRGRELRPPSLTARLRWRRRRPSCAALRWWGKVWTARRMTAGSARQPGSWRATHQHYSGLLTGPRWHITLFYPAAYWQVLGTYYTYCVLLKFSGLLTGPWNILHLLCFTKVQRLTDRQVLGTYYTYCVLLKFSGLLTGPRNKLHLLCFTKVQRLTDRSSEHITLTVIY